MGSDRVGRRITPCSAHSTCAGNGRVEKSTSIWKNLFFDRVNHRKLMGQIAKLIRASCCLISSGMSEGPGDGERTGQSDREGIPRMTRFRHCLSNLRSRELDATWTPGTPLCSLRGGCTSTFAANARVTGDGSICASHNQKLKRKVNEARVRWHDRRTEVPRFSFTRLSRPSSHDRARKSLERCKPAIRETNAKAKGVRIKTTMEEAGPSLCGACSAIRLLRTPPKVFERSHSLGGPVYDAGRSWRQWKHQDSPSSTHRTGSSRVVFFFFFFVFFFFLFFFFLPQYGR